MITAYEIEFRRATLALAADAETQISLFPPFVCFGDELVLDWDDALRGIRAMSLQLSVEAQSAITELEKKIDAYSGSKNEGMFCDPKALSLDPRWTEILLLALAVCNAHGWKIEPPWRSGAAYVPGSK